MQISVRTKQKCKLCSGLGWSTNKYSSSVSTIFDTDGIEYACEHCNGAGHTHEKKYMDIQSLAKIINKINKRGKHDGKKR
mgnify:CR=1 FL=1